ncbi:hypothetical protein M2427_002789 [Bradyrhizobium sp. BR13661]|jgi:hypothetical protein|nr:hypothetical protein [Bradyrhizobium sp. BR13661]
MRTKMLAASILFLGCVSGTTAQAGVPDTAERIALAPATRGWLAKEAEELLIMLRIWKPRPPEPPPTIGRLDTMPLTPPGGYHNPFETQGLSRSNDILRPLPFPKHDLNLSAPAQDSTASTTTTTDKKSTHDLLWGTSTVGGGATYCGLSGKCKP